MLKFEKEKIRGKLTKISDENLPEFDLVNP